MSDNVVPVNLYGCRWAWCRLAFPDNDELGTHVVFEHIRRAIPVRRKDLPTIRRVEEGLGDSLRISEFMRDTSSSQYELLKGPEQLPASSSLPSPPASSPVLASQDREDTEQEANSTGEHPTFASLSSPAGSLASLKIPASPSFSTLVRRTKKRRQASETQQELFGKRSKQDSFSQESASAVSTGSQRSVEEHLTQSSERDEDEGYSDAEADAQHEGDFSDGQAGHSREDELMIPPAPSRSPSVLPESSQQDGFNGKLNWDQSHRLSTQFASQPSINSGRDEGANPFVDSMSQPPSQLQLSSPLYHIHRSPSQLPSQTDTDASVLSLPINPVATASPAGFTFSTPQRQTWYQSALRRKVSSRSSSGETTPKISSRKREPSGALPTVSEEQSQQGGSKTQFPKTPQPVRSPKTAGFRSGTLHVTRPSVSPLRQPQPQSPLGSQPLASRTVANEGTRSRNAAIIRDVFIVSEEKSDSWDSQPQFDQQSPMSLDISSSSYPPLQTQAPYRSQSFS